MLPIHANIHTPMVESTMQSDSQLIRRIQGEVSCLGTLGIKLATSQLQVSHPHWCFLRDKFGLTGKNIFSLSLSLLVTDEEKCILKAKVKKRDVSTRENGAREMERRWVMKSMLTWLPEYFTVTK